jgi:hypothetical protein
MLRVLKNVLRFAVIAPVFTAVVMLVIFCGVIFDLVQRPGDN